MLTSSNNQKKYNSKTARSKTSSNFYRKNKKITENQLAIEETKKLYQKYYESPNTMLLSQLKTETINIFLDNYKFNDITVITKLLNKYFYFKYLTLAPYDPMKKSPKSRKNNNRGPITEGEKVKMEKEKRDQEVEYMHMVNKITLGIGKHLTLSDNLIALSLVNLDISQKLAENLSKGIIENKSIHALSVNNCKMSIEVYEILLKGLLNHEKIEYLDLHNNNLGDKYGNMIGRIIARQTYRRDQEIWLYGLRNEFPETNDYTLGLISINLDGNNLSSYSADCITTSLSSDQYVRSIILSNNDFDKNSCKKFIYMLRRNMTLLNIDIRDNPGYDDNIKTRLIMKMSKNIRNLYVQFKSKVYTEKEFQNYKKFIDTSFFDLDIPEEIIELYNNNFQKITEGNLTLSDLNNKTKDKNSNNINKVMSDIQEEEKEYTNSNVSKNSLSVLTINSKNKNKNKMEKSNNKNQNNISEKENKKLIEENLLLKKQILELKAENVQKKLGKNLNIPNVYNMNNFEKNYKIADELFDKLNEVMITMGNNNENENKKNIIENKKEKNNGIINENENKSENQIISNDLKNESIKNIKNIIEEEKDNNAVNNNVIINKENEKNKVVEERVKKEEKKEKEKGDLKEKGKEKEDKNIIKGSGGKKDKIIDKDEREGEEYMDELNEEDYTMMQHQQLYEQLKKEYDAKGVKFDIEDYMELLQHAAEQEEEEGENEDF